MLINRTSIVGGSSSSENRSNRDQTLNEIGRQQFISPDNIPDVANLLIIGNSETSLLLSYNLQNVAKFTRIIHVRNTPDALTVLMMQEFAVVIIDDDTIEIEGSSFSRIIKLNQPLARIIVISNNTSKELLIDLINLGSIDSYMELPIDDFTAQSIILEQQARYEINHTLSQLILHPPKFSEASYLREKEFDQKISEYDLVGCVISFETVTRYVYFRRDYLNTDEILLSGYMSAITMLGETLFSNTSIDSIDFGGISALFKSHDKLHFAFFIEGITQDNQVLADSFLEELSSEIHVKFGTSLESGIIAEKDSQELNDMIEKMIRRLLGISDKYKKTEKPIILSFGAEFLKLEILLENLSDRYNIVKMKDEDKAYTFLSENSVDVVLITPIISSIQSYLGFAARVLDILPKTQILGVNYRFSEPQLVTILNSGVISKVITPHITANVFELWIKKCIESAHAIDLSSNDGLKQRVLISYENPVVQKTILRKSPASFKILQRPEFYGLFIARDIMPYYSKFYSTEDLSDSFDDVLFSGFISSLESFSIEMFDSTEQYSGIVLGNATLLIYNHFGLTFAFFMASIDSANYKFVNEIILKSVQELFDLITNVEDLDNLEEYDDTLPLKLEQILNELFLTVSSLSF